MDVSKAPQEKVQSCSHCGKDAKKHCAACHGAPNGKGGHVEASWYCGGACQKADWDKHKVSCKASQARRILYRAGETVQMAFFLYRKVFFDKQILRVEKKKGEINLYEGSYNREDILYPFPAPLFPNQDEKRAVLVFDCCEDAIGIMHHFTTTVLRGIYSDILEVNVRDKNRAIKLVIRRPNNVQGIPTVDHGGRQPEVLKVTLKNLETYALDFTGAQYGQFTSVMPWQQYLDNCARCIVGTRALGETREGLKKLCTEPGWMGKLMSLHMFAAGKFDLAINKWAEEHLKLEALMKLPEATFHQEREHLMRTINTALEAVKDEAEKVGRNAGRKEHILSTLKNLGIDEGHSVLDMGGDGKVFCT